MNDDFEARLARIAAKEHGNAPHQATSPGPESMPPHRRRFPLGRLVSLTGSALAIGLLYVVITGGNLATPAQGKSLFNISFLEDAVQARMTEEEIERMQNDPKLVGKSRM